MPSPSSDWTPRRPTLALASSINSPQEQLGLRAADGTLVTGARLSGMGTMRFSTEIQPLMADLSGMRAAGETAKNVGG